MRMQVFYFSSSALVNVLHTCLLTTDDGCSDFISQSHFSGAWCLWQMLSILKLECVTCTSWYTEPEWFVHKKNYKNVLADIVY